MPRIKLTLEYDGLAYVGWQVQPNGVSVQEKVEHALEALLGEKVKVEVAGRTDAGVHAEGQVAAFTTARTLPVKAYTHGLGQHLPDDIAVVQAEEVDESFDPRRDASGKRYRYLIHNGPLRSALRRNTHWQLFAPLDVGAMRDAAKFLVGRHDFKAFRAADCEAKTTLRELWRVDLETSGPKEIRVTVEGTAFLKHMVRNIVGTLVEVGRGKHAPAWVGEVLQLGDRTLAGQTAPAHGLTMVEVFYRGRSGARGAPPPGAQRRGA